MTTIWPWSMGKFEKFVEAKHPQVFGEWETEHSEYMDLDEYIETEYWDIMVEFLRDWINE